MNPVDEIKKPNYNSKPDYTMTREQNPTVYEFKCRVCDNVLELDFQRQINNSWTGKTDKVDQTEKFEMKSFYSIGLSAKSHDGGQPVFDKINCSNCGAEYMTYCGVNEYSNSAFNVYVHGILRLK
jgi:hypothetical protein